MRTEAELEQLRADIAAQDRERQEVGQLRAEIERLTAENEKMRGAFRVIDSVIPSAIPGNSDTYVKMICARFITQQLTPQKE